ncbi:MAG: aldo/keto reductase [Rhizobiaceae bacterium]|nr:aldo/keto reductase [Rhizobiaceae bacterium]
MRYRAFGRTGWEISEIGFGGWQIGGEWGSVDDDASINTLHHAWDKGINFVDTAELYGEGHSEIVIGRALKGWTGSKIYVATKVRPTRWPKPTDECPGFRGRFPDWYLRESVENSLRRLGVERLDLLQLHSWAPSGHTELDWLETLNDLRIEGKIDQIGISLRDNRPGEGVAPAKLGLAASYQAIFNLFEQTPSDALLPACLTYGAGFIARVPFDSGALIGHWDAGTYDRFEEGSQQHRMFREDRFAETLKRVTALKSDVAPYYGSLAEAAMRFILSDDAVSTVIPGMSTPEEVDLNVVYADGAPFPAELLARLPKHAWSRNYYS